MHEGMTDSLAALALTLAGCAAFALVTGALALRTSGVYFIMITLAFGQMLYFTLTALSQYGGDDGLTLWETSYLLGTNVMQDATGLFYVVLAALAGCWALTDRVARSRFGRVLRAARANPQRAAALGFEVRHVRLAAYVLAGMMAGLAGFLLAHQAEFVSPATGAWQRSGDLIVMVVLGGMGSRNGALLGALFFVGVEEALSSLTHDWRLIFGPLLVLAVLFFRGGLAGLLEPRR
jgi:branched-chain amino acid transport system permease protein